MPFAHLAAATSLHCDSRPLSMDYELSRVADGDISVVKVLNATDLRSMVGDTLFLDHCPLTQCIERDYLLLEFGDHTIIRQKRDITVLLRRSQLRAVGCESRSPIRVIGRLIGWVRFRD